ncbi:MAG TPA: hypothetical protein VIS99_02820 [Terrimicrobiaceae bacterium]
MSDYDPNELLVVCESIIEDGELTYDELYQLADWLNNHHEACLHWPGSLIVEPLQKAWADGKITKTEASLLLAVDQLSLNRRQIWFGALPRYEPDMCSSGRAG